MLIQKNKGLINSKYGKNPNQRTIKELLQKGFILIDKHKAENCHACVDLLKKILKIKKAGHSGTLDPNVTGLIVCGLNKATRLMEYMLKSNKVYICLIFFHKKIKDEELNKAFKKFTGKITQTPPLISAVKRQPRQREIYEMKILDKEKNNQYVLFKVSCEHGTYIRKLCSDMGEFLKVNAQMKELRRVKAGIFEEEKHKIISLDKLRNLFELYKMEKNKIFENELRKFLRPQEELVSNFKKIIVFDDCINSITHGTNIAIPGIYKFDESIKQKDLIAIFSSKEELIAIGEAVLSSSQIKKKDKGICVKTKKVLVEIDYYPRIN